MPTSDVDDSIAGRYASAFAITGKDFHADMRRVLINLPPLSGINAEDWSSYNDRLKEFGEFCAEFIGFIDAFLPDSLSQSKASRWNFVTALAFQFECVFGAKTTAGAEEGIPNWFRENAPKPIVIELSAAEYWESRLEELVKAWRRAVNELCAQLDIVPRSLGLLSGEEWEILISGMSSSDALPVEVSLRRPKDFTSEAYTLLRHTVAAENTETDEMYQPTEESIGTSIYSLVEREGVRKHLNELARMPRRQGERFE